MSKVKFWLLSLLFCFTITSLTAQNLASITGRVTDASVNNESIPYVSVAVKGTSIGAQTDLDGEYHLKLNPGNYVIQFSFVGYQTIERSINLKSNEQIILNQSLVADDFTLDEVVIEGKLNKEKESALLLEQQNAVEIKQSIGAQELSRKGVSDVAAAVVKTTGVSKQEGTGNIYVRGLGDRYNATTLNNLPLPSNDPEKKNISLNLFSTEVVQLISIDKTYNSSIFGDFGGGNVNISSKKYKGIGLFELKLGSSVNLNSIYKSSEFYLQDGPKYFGFTKSEIPENALINYNFQNKLNPIKVNPYGLGLGIKIGKSIDLSDESYLNLFSTISFDNGFEYRNGINQSVNAQGAKIKSFQQQKYTYQTSTTAMLNANYVLNNKNSINYNLMFINSSDQSRDVYKGFIRDIAEDDNGLIQRSTYQRNQLFVNQLLGEHHINERIDVNWGLSYNSISSDMPDRLQNTFKLNSNNYFFAQNTITDNHRYYQNLIEDELAINVLGSYKFGLDSENQKYKSKLNFGYQTRFKQRDFEAIQFNFRISGSQLSNSVNPNLLDSFFNEENYNQQYFKIESFAGMTPQTYRGEQIIHSGFGDFVYHFSDRLTANFGVRFEKINQLVGWRTQLDASGRKNQFSRNEILPSVNLRYKIQDNQNLRLAASKTYTLPQFKERALFIYEDVTEVKVGNPDLYPSQNYNLDLKWELYPKSDELISFTTFGKYIIDPINEITLASSTNDISYINSGDVGYVLGAEVEFRKSIFKVNQSDDNKLSAGLNMSYMKTHQDLNSDKVRNETNYNVNLTHNSSSFTGASEFLLNADLSYYKSFSDNYNLLATVLFSYNSDKLYALGVESKGNIVDKGFGVLDFVLKSKISKSFTIDFVAKNLLNPSINRFQENSSGYVKVLSYKRGGYFSLGVSYQL